MPVAAPKPCRHPACSKLVTDGAGYCEAHKHVAPGSFADKDRGSRHERGYGTKWEKIRKLILQRDCGLCQECLRNGRVHAVGDKPFTAFCDHIVPKAEGGTDDYENLQTLCRSCHTAKTDKEKNKGRAGKKSKP
jgi:5-methylcytosine-specific restriction protein A